MQIIKQNHKRGSLDNHLETKKRKLILILDKQNCESDFILLPFRILSQMLTWNFYEFHKWGKLVLQNQSVVLVKAGNLMWTTTLTKLCWTSHFQTGCTASLGYFGTSFSGQQRSSEECKIKNKGKKTNPTFPNHRKLSFGIHFD